MISSDIDWITQNPYYAYAYSYPHKSAYQDFATPKAIKALWANEKKNDLFLYLHIPFCEMRCGFCNLFTTTNPNSDFVAAFLQSLSRQMETVRGEIGPRTFSRLAIGGGTPTYLSADALQQLFDELNGVFGVQLPGTPASVETSPKTATADRLAVLSAFGVERISIGIQSFLEDETKAIGRPQNRKQIDTALDTIRQFPFPRLNIDLIYGAANQTVKSFLSSLQHAVSWSTEEIYLYPLYVRPQTGLDGRVRAWDRHRLDLYRAGRDYLLERGYSQVSMRMFTKDLPGASIDYCCQEDGMLGFGAGARSYTQTVHYSSDYRVDRPGILSILKDYSNQHANGHRHATHGVELNSEDIMRRDVIKSILRVEGLDCMRFRKRFLGAPTDLVPEIEALLGAGYLREQNNHLIPTPLGLEYSDAIGPWLFSSDLKGTVYQDGLATP